VTDHDEEVTVVLTKAEAKHVAGLIRANVRKRERQYDPDFVPKPGHHHSGKLAIERGLELLGKFEDALDLTVQVWEDEVWEEEA
jgi:hypothetical protein